ncbi:DNA polymerase III subunit alpha [Alicyclobacillus tolerans]|uniref:DNA polymerase III subunit alpha n=1 Tax=Alicyclobacillus tolerans TaxID=90970 RepID=UPI003B7BCEB8
MNGQLDFVHLHVHSAYSLKQSCLSLKDAIETAQSLHMTALALTDKNTLYGAVSFCRLAKSAGITPLIGVDFDVLSEEASESAGRQGNSPLDSLVLLAKGFAGYSSLVKLVTLAHSRSRRPYVQWSEIAQHSHSLIALVGGRGSSIARAFSEADRHKGEQLLQRASEMFPPGELYVQLHDHGLPEERRALPGLIAAARQLGLPLVASNEVYYARREDAAVQKVLAQVDADGLLLPVNHFHLASSEEMAEKFQNLPEAIANTRVIADAAAFEWPKPQLFLPRYPLPPGESAQETLRRVAYVGAKKRYPLWTAEVEERLRYELDVIDRLGFADYFLVVADFIRYAHRQGISTGPGRGSAAGSLVAYALSITDVDPLQYGLLFERFLNPERVSWPDIDIDFEFERRGEVIQYVLERYGDTRVAQIGTFGTFAARAAIRDVGRVLGSDKKLVDTLARLIPSHPGVTLNEALENVTQLRQMEEENLEAKKILAYARRLEGLPRHVSIHAAGVIISPVSLQDWIPVVPGASGMPVTMYPMEDVEALGFLKMDFLGLKTLSLMDMTRQSVAQRIGQPLPEWQQIADGDEATYRMLTRGETSGCFQLESYGVRKVLRDVKPTCLEDLIAVISLYRPGPMENIAEFVAAKHGRQSIRYPHPDLEPILKDTYGVIVYQEQIMQIASRMAGFTLGQADILRRAVSKKKREVLDAERERFVTGCQRRGYSAETANTVYDLIVRFADYGFNRSHAAAYALLAYRTAYLRAHYPADFFAALMTLAAGTPDKITEYTRDAKKLGIQLLPPSVSASGAAFSAESDRSIRTGLLSIRGVGRAAVMEILRAREEAPFTSLVDFLRRVSSRACNRKAVESLATAGAMEAFLPSAKLSEQALSQILDHAYLEAEAGGEQARLFNSDHTFSAHATASGPATLFIRYRAGDDSRTLLAAVRSALLEKPGSTPVALFETSTRKARLLPARYTVKVDPDLIAELETIVGLGNVKLQQRSETARH